MNYTITTSGTNQTYTPRLGFAANGRMSLQNAVKAAYGSNVLYENMTSTEYTCVFRLPDTTFVFMLRLQEQVLELQIGNEWVNGVLQNPVTLPELAWQRGNSGNWAFNHIQTAAFSAAGFLLSIRTPTDITHSGWTQKTLGVSLLVREDGSYDPILLDAWRTNTGYHNEGMQPYMQGEWGTVRRYDQSVFNFVKSQNIRMPYIGFTAFPNGVEAAAGKLYGAKLYSVFAPYHEFALFRTFPGDVVSPGETVVDERGRKWYASDPTNNFWNELNHVFPGQIGIQYSRTGIAW